MAVSLPKQVILCQYCLKATDKPHIDHVNPRKHNGSLRAIENLVVSCPMCNTVKGIRSVEEVFGPHVAERITRHIASRSLTANDERVANEIALATRSGKEMVRLVLDWKLLGLGPIRGGING